MNFLNIFQSRDDRFYAWFEQAAANNVAAAQMLQQLCADFKNAPEAAERGDGNTPASGNLTRLAELDPAAAWRKATSFEGQRRQDTKRIMDLGQVNVCRRHTRLLKGSFG